MILLWVEFVFIMDLVVAQSACVECPGADGVRTLELATTEVMLTAKVASNWFLVAFII